MEILVKYLKFMSGHEGLTTCIKDGKNMVIVEKNPENPNFPKNIYAAVHSDEWQGIKAPIHARALSAIDDAILTNDYGDLWGYNVKFAYGNNNRGFDSMPHGMEFADFCDPDEDYIAIIITEIEFAV